MKFQGTPFQQKVWKELIKIPKGHTISYKELAQRIGKPNAYRAVANAVKKNPYPPFIPCHRVIHSDGTIGGYSGKGGIRTKRKLLKMEGVILLIRAEKKRFFCRNNLHVLSSLVC